MRCHRVEVDVICLIVEECQMYMVVATDLASLPPCHVVEITDVIRSWKNSLDVLTKNICDFSSKSPLRKQGNSLTNIFSFTTMSIYN